MTSPDRLDPLTFAGCFAYLDSDVPPGVTLPVWRSQRTTRSAERLQLAARRSDLDSAGADLAPQNRTLRVPGRAHRPRSGRGPSPRRNR